jgi:mannitol/fructose-specific phosphotransferase system IIA component (Ntr-type)
MAEESVKLRELLKGAIEIVDKPLNFKDAVTSALELLVAKGKIEPVYIDSVFENLSKLGPYFYLGNGIAMPHSRPEDGVKEIGLSMLVLNTPTQISETDAREVEIVIGFCALNANQHVDVMAELATILADDEKVSKIKSSKSQEDVLDAIE